MPDGERKRLMKLFEKLLYFWTKRQLIWQQKRNIASLTILENYLTSSVLEGEQARRNQLIDTQNKMNESQKFLKYLTKKI